MADYCAYTDVEVLIGMTFSTATTPTLAQVNTVISTVTNVIDLQLSVIGINSQPTDARILAKLKDGCIIGTAARCGFGRLNLSANTGDTKPKTYWDMFDAFLKEMIEHPEIYAVVADSESMYSTYNDDYDVDDLNETYLQQDWES